MKRASYLLAIAGFLIFFAGCKSRQNDQDAIRAGINQHLASLKTLNLDAMDMTVTSVSIQGNQAQAQVEFRAKGGAAQGAGMQISYSLQKQNGVWVVQNTEAGDPSSGHASEPNAAPSETSPKNPNSPASDSLPNFRDLVPENGNPNSLPPGHPPVNGQGKTLSQ